MITFLVGLYIVGAVIVVVWYVRDLADGCDWFGDKAFVGFAGILAGCVWPLILVIFALSLPFWAVYKLAAIGKK